MLNYGPYDVYPLVYLFPILGPRHVLSAAVTFSVFLMFREENTSLHGQIACAS